LGEGGREGVDRAVRRPQEIVLRRWEDLLSALAKRFGDLKGRVGIEAVPEVSLQDIGGLRGAKREVESLVFSLNRPELYRRWGTKPIKGVLFYGPPGTGKTLLAKALALESEAIFLHLQIRSIAFKWPMEAGDLFQELFTAIRGSDRVVLYLDELDALAFERIFGTEEARGAGRRAINTLLENLERLDAYEQALVVASTNQADAVDPALIGPGRFDRLIEVPLPDGEEKREIFEIHRKKVEAVAGRPLFKPLDYDAILARTVKMSGADIREIIQRTLEEKARLEGSGQEPGLVETKDLLRVIEEYRKIKEVVEKIRYGQYL
jgi:SpoVK/Ycf46/Vps4 family AAA+-type ATPase